MSQIRGAFKSVVDFIKGAEEHQLTGDYVEIEGEEMDLYLVTYGPYGILPSADPDCLIAMVL